MNTRIIFSLIVSSLTIIFFVQLPSVGAAEAVEETYRYQCMACHGANLEGGLGPNLQHVGSRLSQQAIITKITFGGGQMPAFGGRITPQMIQSLAEWLSAKK